MILRDRRSTSYDLISLFPGRLSTLDRWDGKKRKTHWYEAVRCALNFPFLKDVSHNCFVLDVVNLKNWGSLLDGMRWDEVKKAEKTWDEMSWDGMTQTAVTMGFNEQFPREAAMRWDQMKWEKIQHSKDMASDWQVKSLLLRSTEGLAATYRHSLCSALYAITFQFWNSRLRLPRELLVCNDMYWYIVIIMTHNEIWYNDI